jgi:hypothetical protein
MTATSPEKLVDAEGLRNALFDPPPSLRWVQYQQARRTIPFVKIGRVIRFDVAAVRAALERKFTVRPRGESAAGRLA